MRYIIMIMLLTGCASFNDIADNCDPLVVNFGELTEADMDEESPNQCETEDSIAELSMR